MVDQHELVSPELSYTPPIPDGLPGIDLSENSQLVLSRRYLRKGKDGTPQETVEEMFWRVAYHIAKVEETWGNDINIRSPEFYHLLTSKKFFPNILSLISTFRE